MITGRITNVERVAGNGFPHIVFWVDFYEDGTLLYPNWPLHAKWDNFDQAPQEQIDVWIQKNIEAQCDNFIKVKFAETREPQIIQEKLQKYIGIEHQKETADVDAVVGISDSINKKFTIKADGTFTVVDVSTEAPA